MHLQLVLHLCTPDEERLQLQSMKPVDKMREEGYTPDGRPRSLL